MKNKKCPLVAIIKVRDIPFIPKERALSVLYYAVLNSKTKIFELCRSWSKWAIYANNHQIQKEGLTSSYQIWEKTNPVNYIFK